MDNQTMRKLVYVRLDGYEDENVVKERNKILGKEDLRVVRFRKRDTQLMDLRKVRLGQLPEFTDYLYTHLSVTNACIDIIRNKGDIESIPTLLSNVGVEDYLKYYMNTSSNKMKNLGILKISNLVTKNFIYIIDYFTVYKGKEIIKPDILDSLIEQYNWKSMCLERHLDYYNERDSYVIRNHTIIHIDDDIKPRKRYKDDTIMVDLGRGDYKAIPYKYYKRLYMIERVKINYGMADESHNDGDDTIQVFQNVAELDSISRIIKFCQRYFHELQFVKHDLGNADFYRILTYGAYRIQVFLKDSEEVLVYKSMRDFLNQFMPGGF